MKNRIYSVITCLIFSYNLCAQLHQDEIGIQSDNDAYLAQGSDRYYTNGIFIYYNHSLNHKQTYKSLANNVLSFDFGQKLFTSETAFVTSRRQIDRPFAAYLYIGSALNLLYQNESNIKIGVQLGVVGPAAQGEVLQKYIHKTLSFYPIRGWQYQIENDIELNFSGEYNKLLARGAWADISINSYANIGNGFTGIGIGTLLRFGNFNQLFNSISTQSTAIKAVKILPLHSKEIFFYYKPQINLIVYDATIQGSLFKPKPANSLQITLDPKRLSLSQQFGLAYTSNRLIINLAAIFCTKNVKQMYASTHQWGTITFFYRFN